MNSTMCKIHLKNGHEFYTSERHESLIDRINAANQHHQVMIPLNAKKLSDDGQPDTTEMIYINIQMIEVIIEGAQ